MAVVFLIGGTGNQLFQYAASAPTDRFSGIFLQSNVRRLLKWTDHEQAIDFPMAPWPRQVLSLVALLLDLMLARFFRLSLFTAFDARKYKMTPRLVELNRFGYFQNAPERRELADIALQISPEVHKGRIVIHVRGGDLLEIERAGKNVYGLLDRTYFLDGITQARTALMAVGNSDATLLVVTDDPQYAASLKLGLAGGDDAEIVSPPLGETLALAVGADWFVASNSTLSYWIVRLRGGKRSIAPQPFQKRKDFILPTETARVAVDFG